MARTGRRPVGTVAARLAELAAAAPDRLALTTWTGREPATLSRAELSGQSQAVAGLLRGRGVRPGGRTIVACGNVAQFVLAVLGTWMAGATPMIVPPAASDGELATLLGGQDPADLLRVDAELLADATSTPQPATPDQVTPGPDPAIGWFLPSGGTTGLPRLVPAPLPPLRLLDGHRLVLTQVGWRADHTQLVVGPLHHAAPFTCAMAGLLGGNHLALLARLTPPDLVRACTDVHPQWCQLTPHQMAVIGRNEAGAVAFGASLEALMHTAGPCPPDVKRRWIERLGAERIYELYGSTQMVGVTTCRGDEWLAHPGTVGRPFLTDVRVVDPAGAPVPPGTVGEVLMRTLATRATPRQAWGAAARDEGFRGVGDAGYVDADGFLYLTDRVDDVIIVGGANVSPREIEDVLAGYPGVREVIVVGRPHRLLGQGVHALVVPDDGATVDPREVQAWCGGRLEAHKIPLTVELTEPLARTHAGKVARHLYRNEQASRV